MSRLRMIFVGVLERRLRTPMALGADLAIIIVAVLVYLHQNSWLSYAAAFLLIGSRQVALGVLVHECVHGHCGTEKPLVRWFLTVVVPFLLFFSYTEYRCRHLRHHAFLNTPRDPDWQAGRPDDLLQADSPFRLLLVVSGFARLQERRRYGGQVFSFGSVTRQWPRLVCYALFFGALAHQSLLDEWALIWALPYIGYFLPVLRLRGIAEHWGVPCQTVSCQGGARSLRTGPLATFLFFPHGSGRHAEHHHRPSLAWYDLGSLDTSSMGIAQTEGLAGLLRELVVASAWPVRRL